MPFTILIDTREQHRFDFPDCDSKVATLTTGDYSIEGLTELVAVERKSLEDLIGCMTTGSKSHPSDGRERFKRELQRLKAYKCRAVVVECNLEHILTHSYRSEMHPNSVIGSLASWQTRYDVPFVFAGDHKQGAVITEAILRTYYSQMEKFLKGIANAF